MDIDANCQSGTGERCRLRLSTTSYTSDGQKFVSGDGSFQVPKGTTILCSRTGVVTVSPGATKLVDITELSEPSLWLITEDCTIRRA